MIVSNILGYFGRNKQNSYAALSNTRPTAIPRKHKKNCITFVQRRRNGFDVGPALYRCYTNVLCLPG